jgi:6-phosphofructo-2-kinase/fructose-2,6-biphosphatase 2
MSFVHFPCLFKLTERSQREGIKENHNAEYFSHTNPEATSSRERLAQDSLEMLIQWLKEGGNVGIHGTQISSSDINNMLNWLLDATNSTRSRRYSFDHAFL